MSSPDVIDDTLLAARTRHWIERIAGRVRVLQVERLIGGWTSDMYRVRVQTATGEEDWALRSFTKPFFVQYSELLLQREARMLESLTPRGVPVPRCLGVDAQAEYCAHPALLRTHLPGSVQLSERNAEQRMQLMAAMLVRIHRCQLPAEERPRTYHLWTPPARVKLPETSAHRERWQRAHEIMSEPPPAYEGCLLHRDFQPGNVLFEAAPALHISGVIDWVETSWGPADLDVAHTSTALAILHGAEAGLAFADRYCEAGGELASDPHARLYWYLVDALHYPPDAEKLTSSWRQLGRTDLTPEVAAERLEQYVLALLARFDRV